MHPPSSIFSTHGKPSIQRSIAVGGSYPLCALDTGNQDICLGEILVSYLKTLKGLSI